MQAILAEVTHIRPELTAFFGCLYYGALRPAEAVALRASSLARSWPTKIRRNPADSVRHASVPQLDTAGHHWTRHPGQDR